MARIICIDYGAKRTGIAVTDPLKIIATPLETVATETLFEFLKKYFAENEVELMLVGEPKNLNDSDTHITAAVIKFVADVKKKFPQMPVETIDERYSSKMAVAALVEMGMKKKKRREKRNIDVTAATLMLQEYLSKI